jgi:soluble lytic murein transglycosylase-like protein
LFTFTAILPAMRALLVLLLLCSTARAASLPSLLPEMPAESGASSRGRLLPLIQAEAQRLGVPVALADAVATIETNYTENAAGSSGEIGLMQVMPSTAWMLGFRGNSTDLFDPAINIHYGVTYLARALAASGGNLCRALMKYRAGTAQEGFSPLSIQYCRHAGAVLAQRGSALAQQVAATTPAAPELADPYMIATNGGVRARPNMAVFAALMGESGVAVEKPVAAWHISGPPGHVRVQAVMDVLRDDDGGDPHEVHVAQDGDTQSD